MPTTQQDELKARIERDLPSNSRVRMIMFRKLLKDIVDLIFNQPGNSTNDYETLMSKVFGSLDEPDLPGKLGVTNILSYLTKGLKTKLIELPEGITINDLIGTTPLTNNLFFEVKPDELIFIKQKVKKEETDIYNAFELYVFNNGAGKWGRKGSTNPDNSIKPVYLDNFILLNKDLFFTQEAQSVIMGEKTLAEYLSVMQGLGYSSILDFIENSQIGDKTTEDVIATTTVGAINAGETVPVGTNIQKLTELLLNKTFYPTFVDPTFSLTNNSINSPKEVGSLANITLTFNFDRGKILGKLVSGIWDEDEQQDYRAGEAISYSLNGVSSNPATVNVLTVLGTNTLNGSVTYGIGVQPKDSKGNNYDNPFPAGTSPIESTSFEGIYPYFYYKSTSPITPEIMQSAIANGQATKVLASSTGTITIPFAANGEYIAVAYPETSTTKTIWYVNALDNGVIPGGLLGGVNTLPCNSPTNLWSNVNFKIHVSAGLITQPNPIQLKNS